MRILFCSLLGPAIIFFLLLSSGMAAIDFYTHPIRPFSFSENGTLRGLAVEIVYEMMERCGQSREITLIPFSRGLQRVQHEEDTAFFIVAKRPEREDAVKWVGPIISSGVYFYKRKDRDITIATLDDLKNHDLAIGVGRGNADHTFLQSQGVTNLHPAADHKRSLMMLMAKRVDVTPMSELVMPEVAREAGIGLEEIENTMVKLYESSLYLVFSLNVPDATITKWQKALDEMKSSGRYRELVDTYLEKQRGR